jgi:hypothetical protein
MNHKPSTFYNQKITHSWETMSPPVKIILLILVGIFLRIAYTPPNPPTKGDRVLDRRTLFEKVLHKLGIFIQVR